MKSTIRPSTYQPVNFDMKLLDYMTQSEQEQALAYFEALTKIEAKDHLRVFAGRNGYTPAKHHQLLIDHLEALERREIQNLLVITPPGAAKSTYSSILFPAWYLGRNPKHMVLATSNTMELAERFGRKVRGLVAAADFGEIFGNVGLSEESAAAARWETTQGGEMFAVGVGGSIVGRRGDCLLGWTRVMMDYGPEAIDMVRVGERVASVQTDGSVSFRKVLATRKSSAREFIVITTRSGVIVEATAGHRVFANGEFKAVSSLMLGDTLRRSVGGQGIVDDTVVQLELMDMGEDGVDVFDIQVEGSENFFANGILVHNCLLMDDVVRSKEDVESEQLRKKVWDWYVSDVLTRLKPNAVKLLVNTRWHEDDLAGRILEREGDKWTVLHMEMENTREDDPLGRAIGERLWPEWFTQEMVDEAKQDVGTWNALYQGRPSPDGGGEFKKDWVEYYDSPPDRKRVTTLMLVDPANTKTKKSDYTAMWVLGAGGDDNFYVLDMIRDRFDLAERVDKVFQLHRKWRPVEVRYEQYGLQTDIDSLKIEMDRRSYRFKIRPVAGTHISKEDRIRRLIPYFKNGRIIFPHELIYTDHTGNPKDMVKYFVDEEYAPFPVAKKKDLHDALSRLAEPGLVLPKHVTEEEKKEMFMLAETEFVPNDPVMGY